MPLGNFTRQTLETDAANLIEQVFRTFGELERLRGRAQAEFAAGTLDGASFYQGATADRANMLGALDDMHAVWLAIQGQPLPTLDYQRYVKFLF